MFCFVLLPFCVSWMYSTLYLYHHLIPAIPIHCWSHLLSATISSTAWIFIIWHLMPFLNSKSSEFTFYIFTWEYSCLSTCWHGIPFLLPTWDGIMTHLMTPEAFYLAQAFLSSCILSFYPSPSQWEQSHLSPLVVLNKLATWFLLAQDQSKALRTSARYHEHKHPKQMASRKEQVHS